MKKHCEKYQKIARNNEIYQSRKQKDEKCQILR